MSVINCIYVKSEERRPWYLSFSLKDMGSEMSMRLFVTSHTMSSAEIQNVKSQNTPWIQLPLNKK